LVSNRLYAQSQVRYPHAFQNPFVTAIAMFAPRSDWREPGIFSVFHQVLLQALRGSRSVALVNLSRPDEPASELRRAATVMRSSSYAMSATAEDQTVFTDIAAHVASAQTSLRGGRRRAARACSCLAAISRCWSCSRRWDELLNSNDEQTRRDPLVVLSYNIVVAIASISTILNSITSTPSLIVGAAEGARGTTMDAACVFVRSRCARCWTPRPVGRPDGLLGVLFARLRPGGTIEAARAYSARSIAPYIMDVDARCRRT